MAQHPLGMSRLFAADIPVLRETGSVLTREALDAGLSHEDIRNLVRDGVWTRVRRGAYAQREQWRAITPEQRHLLTAKAVVRGLAHPVALAHVSAAIALGLPTWGSDLRDVHVTRQSRRHGARAEAGVVHHAATLPGGHVVGVDGIRVTSAARTVVDHARSVGFEAAVVTLDAALNRALVSNDAVLDMLEWQQDWPGARGAGGAVEFSDRGADSPGESRSRVRIHQAGLPAPRLQSVIRDERGRFVGQSDFLFEENGTIAEFDGRLKYRLATAGASLEDVLWKEKRREDAFRALGYEVVRITWDDLARAPSWWRQRFLQAFARASGRPRPVGSVA